MFPSVMLHRHKTEAIRRFHPWVFSGAVKRADKGLQAGDVVEIFSDDGAYLGTGHYGTGSVAVRVFSFVRVNDLQQLWIDKLRSAYQLRKSVGLTDSAFTNTYRLVFGEGDGLPGMIIDWYNGTAVLQAHSVGMHRQAAAFAEALKVVYGNQLKAVYDKSSDALSKAEGTNAVAGEYLFGNPETDVVNENGHAFKIDWIGGQKTGFFIDQRDNRQLLSVYSKGKKVLNTFCYSGGFSVYALKAGAELVHSVDSSAKAIELTNQNIALNALNENKHQSFTADVFDFLRDCTEGYDIVVLDPPAFAKHQSARHTAIKAYKRLNLAALNKMKAGSLLFTFSCSQVVNSEMFTGAVASAAIESGRKISILHQLSQPADHPVSIYNREAQYLKGLVLYVE
ncbi:MAG: class I SAM-dependent rRNA methyltransferase [Chitinophagales bacterium]|nr:class I SAM-dependent rRNA methyltransferase [Chitinophagales bacterium]